MTLKPYTLLRQLNNFGVLGSRFKSFHPDYNNPTKKGIPSSVFLLLVKYEQNVLCSESDHVPIYSGLDSLFLPTIFFRNLNIFFKLSGKDLYEITSFTKTSI